MRCARAALDVSIALAGGNVLAVGGLEVEAVLAGFVRADLELGWQCRSPVQLSRTAETLAPVRRVMSSNLDGEDARRWATKKAMLLLAECLLGQNPRVAE
jgi:hypothetical protein